METNSADRRAPDHEALDSLARDFSQAHPEEASRLLARLSPEDTAAFLGSTPPGVAAGVASLMTAQDFGACLTLIDKEAVGPLLETMPLDQVACALRRVGEVERREIVAVLEDGPKRSLTTLLRYEENSAGALMEPVILTVALDTHAHEALETVSRNKAHLRYYVYVVDNEERLVGVVDLRSLMNADPESAVKASMRKEVERLSARTGRDAILRHQGWERFHTLPVVDQGNILVGILRYETMQRLARGERPHRPPATTMINLAELFWEGSQRVLGEFVDLASGGRDA